MVSLDSPDGETQKLATCVVVTFLRAAVGNDVTALCPLPTEAFFPH